jgi:pimeloyl-ACP methyl ester carboxylesterase
LGLVSALGYREVALVAGRDFGASVAAWCALVWPDVFRSVVLQALQPMQRDTSISLATSGSLPPRTSGVAKVVAERRRCRGIAATP